MNVLRSKKGRREKLDRFDPANFPEQNLVRKEGFEPPRPFGHKILSLARLPIPPLPHRQVNNLQNTIRYLSPFFVSGAVGREVFWSVRKPFRVLDSIPRENWLEEEVFVPVSVSAVVLLFAPLRRRRMRWSGEKD
jgi:hypothetical protein